MTEEFFAVAAEQSDFVPSTLDPKNRTVDVVWYGGATVPRQDPDTGDDYMLRLDMSGAKLDRLNAGAPVFDSHQRGGGQGGTSKAQRGVVRKAWSDGQKGLATLQFRPEGEDPDTDQMFSDIQSGVLRNLSFGTWIYDKQPETTSAGASSNTFVATNWEPFEISPIPVAADFTTQFLGATRADSPKGATQPMPDKTQQGTGETARVDEAVLAAARTEAIQLEQQRATGVETLCATAKKLGVEDTFTSALIKKNLSVEDARKEIFAEMEKKGQANTKGVQTPIRSEAVTTRDGEETRLACMQEAILFRVDPNHYAKASDEVRREKQLMAREYNGFSLMEMSRAALFLAGINTTGWSKTRIAGEALNYRRLPQIFGGDSEDFGGGAETTSDFPSILANVANKTLRQSFQAYPQTFKPFCRQVTAPDFKPINRMQLNDLASLPKLNEKGEFRHLNLTDSGISYSLATFGGIIALSRKAIINDDLQAFTRTSGQLGVAASRAQSDTVWGIITANTQLMQDGTVLFTAGHGNLITGASSALTYSTASDTTAALTAARAAMRQQKGPQGTPLDLIPRYIATGTVNETPLLKMIYPLNLASNNVAAVIPEWLRGTIPVIEPRLDAANNPWYMIADPALIDTIEYCFLEGQEGVYFETRQGFETDGIEMKARMDFAAAAIEQRGLQKNAGA